MLSEKYRLFWIALAVVYMGAILLMAGQSITLSESKRADRLISNLLHIPAFTILILILIPAIWSNRRHWFKTIVAAGAIAFVFGVGIELYQITVPLRSPSIIDIALNSAGIFIGVLFFYLGVNYT